MKRFAYLFMLLFHTICSGLSTDADPMEKSGLYWPQWRGPLGTGVAQNANPPIEWSESKNIRWKINLPGKGHSTPIIWKERIFITTAVPYGKRIKPTPDFAPGAHDNLPADSAYKFKILAIRRTSGKTIWERTVRQEIPHEGGHYTGSLASNSPVTDGKHLFAFFGSRGLYCLDWAGNVVWEKDLGNLQTRHAHGEGSSPALYKNTLIINWDHQGDSFVYAFEKNTGKQIWKVARDEITSWSTPIVVDHEEKPQVIISATNRVRSYDLANGEVIWECKGLSRNVVASPVAADGMVYVGNSYDWQAMLAIQLEGAKGDLTGTDKIVWTLDKHTPYVPSPLLYGNTLYFLKHNQNILSSIHAKTGKKRHKPFRLPGIRNVFASPIGAADRIYISDRDGMTIVIRHGDQPDILAKNQLNDRFSASGALVDEELYLRGENYLYCIAEER